jgi:cytochrome c oxidase subunit II
MKRFPTSGETSKMILSLKIFPALLAATLFIPAMAAGPAEVPRRIEFRVGQYAYEPSEINLKRGEPVILVLKSKDVTHGFLFRELAVSVELKKGRVAEVPLPPTETGSFSRVQPLLRRRSPFHDSWN